VFSPVGKQKKFNHETLMHLFKAEKTPHIDILEQMELKGILEIYHLYHFRNFYPKERPLTLEQFMQFVLQFDVKVLFENEHELFFEKNANVYHVHVLGGDHIGEKVFKRKEQELRDIYAETKDKMHQLTKKRDFLQRILKIKN
jgi:hypothetical protein